MFDLIAFDADDTLWHSENLYVAAQARFAGLMAAYGGREAVLSALHATEMGNLQRYGYGVKGFVLSMIETALAISDRRATAAEIAAIIAEGRELLDAEVRLLDGAEEVLAALAAATPLMVLTKGDLSHQASKLERSGLARYFRHVEIVADKTRDLYASLLAGHGISPGRFLMVGNSLRSDIVPVLELGGWAVFIPYQITWSHEHVELPPELAACYREIEHLGQLPALLAGLGQTAPA